MKFRIAKFELSGAIFEGSKHITWLYFTEEHNHTHYASVNCNFPSKHMLAGRPFDFLYPITPNLCILLRRIETFHILFNTIYH